MTPSARPRRGAVNLRALETLTKRQSALVAELAHVSAEIERILTGAPPLTERVSRLRQAFDAAWCARYCPGYVKRYIWTPSRDEPVLRRLLTHLDDTELDARIGRYLASDGEYYREARHNFGVFAATINDWTAPAEAPTHHTTAEDEIQATKARLRRLGVEDYTR